MAHLTGGVIPGMFQKDDFPVLQVSFSIDYYSNSFTNTYIFGGLIITSLSEQFGLNVSVFNHKKSKFIV